MKNLNESFQFLPSVIRLKSGFCVCQRTFTRTRGVRESMIIYLHHCFDTDLNVWMLKANRSCFFCGTGGCIVIEGKNMFSMMSLRLSWKWIRVMGWGAF